jgi:hypothetical protein
MQDDETYYAFGQRLAQALLRGDYEAASSFLAPWLQRGLGAEQLQNLFKREFYSIADEHQLATMIAPKACRVSGNISRLADLRAFTTWAPPRHIPREVTEGNFRKWMVVELKPGADDEVDFDFWARFWAIVVEDHGELRIGYLEFDS